MMYALCVVAFKNMHLMRRPLNFYKDLLNGCNSELASSLRSSLYQPPYPLLSHQPKQIKACENITRPRGWPQSEISKYIDRLIAEEKGTNNE